MFIRWRMYQRQHRHEKHDRYVVRPYLVQSYRWKKETIREMTTQMGASREDFEQVWAERKHSINRSRHQTLFTFMTFRACDYVHYDEPVHIENRLRYWQYLDWLLTDGPLDDLDGETKAKIRGEFESVLPRPYGYLLEILEEAYNGGMPEAPPFNIKRI